LPAACFSAAVFSFHMNSKRDCLQSERERPREKVRERERERAMRFSYGPIHIGICNITAKKLTWRGNPGDMDIWRVFYVCFFVIIDFMLNMEFSDC